MILTRREKRIVDLRAKGMTYREIGFVFSISRERVRQILGIIKGNPKVARYSPQPKIHQICVCGKNIFTSQRQKYCPTCSKDLAHMEGRDHVREIVRIKQKRTCQDCGKKWRSGQRRFDVHHKDGLCGRKSQDYDSRYEMDVLICLCHKCHMSRHAKNIKPRLHRKINNEKKTAIGVLAREGFSKRRISIMVGLSYPTVCKWA